MDRQELIDRVKVELDELTPADVSQSFDEYISPMLDESAKEMCDTAPIHLLTSVALLIVKDTDMYYDSDLAYIKVPSDYSRIVEIKFTNWEVPIYMTLDPLSPEFKNQDNDYLKSGYGRPTVRIKDVKLSSPPLQKYLVCGKVVLDEVVLVATYIPYVLAQNLAVKLHEPLTWLCCAKILQITEMLPLSKAAREQYVASLTGKI